MLLRNVGTPPTRQYGVNDSDLIGYALIVIMVYSHGSDGLDHISASYLDTSIIYVLLLPSLHGGGGRLLIGWVR
jgi:hypothetical protein